MGNFKPDPSFDDLAPTTTKGDLIARDTSTNVRIPVGANGLFLKASSGATGGVAWDAPNGTLNYFTLAGATTLPGLNAFYALSASAAAFSVTLPTSGSTASALFLKKTDVTLNGITLVGPINGGSLYNLATKDETLQMYWDGSQYTIAQHLTKTAPTAYAAGFTNFGTVNGASVGMFSWRDGKFLEICGYFTVGTPVAAPNAFSIGFGGSNIPAGLTIDQTLGASYRPVGNWGSYNPNNAFALVITNGPTMLSLAASGATLAPHPGNGLAGAGGYFAVGRVSVPIAGWQP